MPSNKETYEINPNLETIIVYTLLVLDRNTLKAIGLPSLKIDTLTQDQTLDEAV